MNTIHFVAFSRALKCLLKIHFNIDNWTYFCQFSGAPKSWYCVPPKYGHLLEKLAKEVFSETSTLCTNFMRHKTCIISPKVLEKHNIPYNKLVQKAREIIIVFPYAHHSGFNHGFNIAEAINFASPRWIEYGKRHRPCDCDKSRYIPIHCILFYFLDPFTCFWQVQNWF